MSLITQSELNQLRADANRLLPDEVVISRPAETTDSQGGSTTVWSNVNTVNCRLEPIMRISLSTEESGGELPIASKAWFVLMPAETDVRPIDRLTVNGRQYEVIGVRSPRTDEVLCRTECETLNIDGPA